MIDGVEDVDRLLAVLRQHGVVAWKGLGVEVQLGMTFAAPAAASDPTGMTAEQVAELRLRAQSEVDKDLFGDGLGYVGHG